MTTELQGRFYTYYDKGQYGCKCLFCTNWIEPSGARWYSPPKDGYGPVYACTKCFDGNRIREPGQEALPRGNDGPPPQSSSREAAITKAHAENMESARQTRDMLALLVTAIVESTKVHAERNVLLRTVGGKEVT